MHSGKWVHYFLLFAGSGVGTSSEVCANKLKPRDSKQDYESGMRVSLFDMPLDIGVTKQLVMESFDSGSLLLSYLNPYAYSITGSNEDYAANLGKFDFIVCDGIGVQVAVKTVFRITTEVISLDYSGIGHDYLQRGSDRKLSLCLVGGKSDVADTAAQEIRKRYPGYSGVTSFGGYGGSPQEAKSFILRSRPNLVLAGLGMGRQEAYLLDLVDFGWSGIGICVGGFFDKLADPKLDYPEWAKKTKLRFLSRLIREPRRLSRRYFIEYQPFVKMYLRHLFT
jgi:N-acetylglucosaminyldiphosphoundecaprenol N-acetyl-beta-D-mannosaminyltransferase